MTRYYLKADHQKRYQEVTKEQFIQAERNAGFSGHSDNQPATAGFSGRGISGKVKFYPARKRKKK